MIRIKPYTALPAHDEIERLYLKLVARALPFEEKDMAGDDNPFPVGLFDEKKSKAGSPPDPKTSREIIQKYSPTLYRFLFDCSKKLKRDSLHKLLFSPMDEDSLKQNGLDAVIKAADQNRAIPLSSVFSYDRFCSSSKIHSFVRMLDVEVCPYCNRSFTTTLVKGKTGGVKTRPELDHYLSKTQYPYFALSIQNLVPSCGTCNRLKSNRDDRILYPYGEAMGDRYRFETQAKEDISYVMGARVDFDLKLVPHGELDGGFQTRAENAKQILGLEELYRQAHQAFVSDIFFQRYVFTDELLQDAAAGASDNFSTVIGGITTIYRHCCTDATTYSGMKY